MERSKCRLAMLRPCNSEEYGQLVHKMIVDFFNRRIVPFKAENETRAGEADNCVDKASEDDRFVVDDYDVQNAVEYPEDIKLYDGVVIVGSIANAFDNDPWIHALMKYILFLHNNDVPLLGICFGHQIIGRALGGAVRRSPNGAQRMSKTLHLTQEGQENLIPLGLPRGQKGLNFMYTHKDEVFELPSKNSDFEVFNVGGDDAIPVHGLVVKKFGPTGESKLSVFSLQGHPEYLTVVGHQSLRNTAINMDETASKKFFKSCEEASMKDAFVLADICSNFFLSKMKAA